MVTMDMDLGTDMRTDMGTDMAMGDTVTARLITVSNKSYCLLSVFAIFTQKQVHKAWPMNVLFVNSMVIQIEIMLVNS